MEIYLLKCHRNGRNDYVHQAQKLCRENTKRDKAINKKRDKTQTQALSIHASKT
jgi:hypothetical protein